MGIPEKTTHKRQHQHGGLTHRNRSAKKNQQD
jgi:hypothetical protein